MNNDMIIKEMKAILKNNIFTLQNKGSYLFDEDTYAILPGNISLFIKRNNIVWNNIKPKHKYFIFHDRSGFKFRTYKNELHPRENEFLISIDVGANCVVTFTPIGDKVHELSLISV